MNEIAVIVPCYKRPEYTEKCIRSIEEAQDYSNTTFILVDDGSKDGTSGILHEAKLPKQVRVNLENMGLRNTLIDFFKTASSYKYIVKMDNDCTVPANWLNDIVRFLDSGWVDILSPNVFPSDAAFVHGCCEEPHQPGIRPSKIVGGLWAMRSDLLDGINFEAYHTSGIRGAWALLNQIIVEKEPRVGWLSNVTVQDIGHFSGAHPEHIASEDHQAYSAEVGRRIAWQA